MTQIIMTPISIGERLKYLEYLLLADESEEMVKQYINDGDLFTVFYETSLIGVVLFTIIENHKTIELKNIALIESSRGKGYGKDIILVACRMYRDMGYSNMLVGTANSSIGNLAFYQKAGFRMVEIKRDFFLQYPESIYENGIRAMDMIMFEKKLEGEDNRI